MTKGRWLTPDDDPGAAICRPVFLPGGMALEAAFRGAFLLLCDPQNWEKHGIQTAQAIADAFEAAYFQTVANWEGRCVAHIIGEIFAYAGTGDPSGAIACDGTIYDATDFPDLFAVIGSAFGGDGIDTFAVPDLRGRVCIGTGQGSGLTQRDLADTGGEETHTLIPDETAVVDHIHTLGIGPQSVANGSDWTVLRTGNPVQFIQATSTQGTQSGPNGDPHENMPPYLALNYFIQAV